MNRRDITLAMSVAGVPLLLAIAPRLALAQQGAVEPIGAARYKEKTLQLGTFTKETSDLAQQRASSPRVREFAGFEAAEQITLAQVLTDTQTPPARPLSAGDAEEIGRLKSASGSAFDQQYLKDQILAHRKLLDVQQAFLQGQQAMNVDRVHIAMLARTMIQMHLTMLTDLLNAAHA